MGSFKIIIILIFLFLGCTLDISPPSFDPPITIIEEINSEVIDAFTIRILWNYDFDEMEVDSFKIYHTSTEHNEQAQSFNFTSIFSIEIDQLSLDPDSLFDYYLNIEDLEYGRWHYFYISAVQGQFESLENDTTSGMLLKIPIPNVTIEDNQNDCRANNYDSDCKLIISTLPDSLSYLDSLIFIRKIGSDSGIVSIDTLTKSSNTDSTFLGLTICSDGGEDLHSSVYCSLIPNTLYTIQYYFEQENENSEGIRRSDSTSFSFNFDRAPISVGEKALTENSCRLYFNNSISDSYYHSILIHDGNTILTTAAIDTLKNINGKLTIDIKNILDEQSSVYCKILGDNSFSVSMYPILLSTLPDDLVGFRLLEREGENSADLYMSIYEIPKDYDPNTGLLMGAIPWEASYCDVKTFINELNIEYQNRNYTFRLPNEDDWNAICGWNFSDYQDFPWGSQIQAHNANYLNSQFPEGSNGITEVGLHPYPNANGIFDLSGNVMEWMDTVDCSQDLEIVKARGGAYYSPPESLKCDNIFNVHVSDSTGMGFHLILEFDQ